ncbi:hypothetical protein J7E71_09845 [Mesobacillus foraminis]|uniref:hypothetical protein n=1 Tax=Mesobacillus foraminis TaxID=279826 RepID=UPI001BE87AB6|nr:hypothetical protein [Mesobacillus foraminis]MBT2756256.1 hypothetical protein [Mesobacillus foraminis]
MKRDSGRKDMDNPEQYATSKKSLYDMHKSEQTVDSIPLEDLKEEQKEEKHGRNTKDVSSTEKKYNVDYQ